MLYMGGCRLMLKELMLNRYLDMHCTRMVKALSYLIPWKALIRMWLEEAFTMDVSFKGCVKKLLLCPSNPPLLSHSIWRNCRIEILIIFFVLCSVRLEEGTVTSLLEVKGTVKGVIYKAKNGEEITACAPLTIVCDGCFSNLRLSLCEPKVKLCFNLTLKSIANKNSCAFCFISKSITCIHHY